MSPRWDRRRRVALGVGICLAFGMAVLAALVAWLATPGGNAWLQTQIEEGATQALQEGRVELGGMRTNVLSEMSFDQVKIFDGAGRTVLGLEALVLDYKLVPLLWREVEIRRVWVEGLVIALGQDAQGVWDFERMLPAGSDSSEFGGWAVEVAAAEIGGQSITLSMAEQTVALGPHQLDLSGHYRDGWAELNVRGLEVEVMEPALGEVILSAEAKSDANKAELEVFRLETAGVALSLEAMVGGLSGTPAGELALSSVALEMEPVGKWMGLDFPLQGEVTGSVRVRGDGEELDIEGRLGLGAGTIEVAAQIEAWQQVPSWEVGLQLSEVDPALYFEELEPSRLTGRISAKGRGWIPGPSTVIEVSLEPGLCLGVEVEAVELTAEIQEDGIHLSRLHLDSPLGRIDADGQFVEDHFRGEVSANVPNLSRLQELGLSDFGGSARAVGRLDWGLGESSVRFEGEMKGNRIKVSDGVVMREAKGPIQLFWKDGVLQGSGRTQARGMEMDEARLGDASIEWSGNFREDGFDVEGFLKAGGLEFGGVRVGAFAGKFRAGASSPLEMDLDIRLREASWQGLRADDGLLRLSLSSDQLMAVELSLEHEQESVLVGSGQARLDTRVLKVEELVLSPKGYDPWTLASPGSLVWHEDGVTDVVVEMSSSSGMMSVRGGGRFNGRVEGLVEIEGLELDWLNSLFELPGWRGAVDADLKVSGSTDALLLDARVSGEQVVIPSLFGGVSVEAEFHTPRSGLVELVLEGSHKNQSLGRLEGTFPVGLGVNEEAVSLGELLWVQPEEPMRATAVVNPVSIRQLETLFPAIDFLPNGRVSAECKLGGTPAKPGFEWRSGWEVRLDPNTSSTRLDFDLFLEDGELLVDGMVHQGGMRRLRLDGGLQTRLESHLEAFWAGGVVPGFEDMDGWVSELDLELVPISMPLSALSPLVGLPEGIEGVLGGGLQIGGSAAQPTIAGALQIVEGKVGGVDMTPALIAISPSDNAYKLMGLFGLGEGSLELAGSLDYDFGSDVALDGLLQREGLSIDVWGRGIPLGILSVVDPAIGKAEGLVTVHGHVGGSVQKPSASLELSLDGGSIEYPPLGVAVEELVLEAETEGDELLIRSASGSTVSLQGRGGRRPGRFKAQGSIPFRGEEPSMAVSLEFEEALFSNLSNLQLVLSGGMLVTGQWPALVFEGDIGVDESRVVIDEEFWLSQATLSLDPGLRIHREEEAVEAEGLQVERAYWEDFVANLSVDLGSNSWGEARVPLDATYGAVSSALSTVAVQGRVRGTLAVEGTLEDALVEGQIETDRAEAVVFGAEFEMERGGLVRFTGSDYQNPELDLSATHETNGYGDVTVDISGTVEAMSLLFRSSEGLSEKDIAALLLLGRPTSELGEGEGGLVEAAVGALAGRAESIGLGDWVDLFQLETEGDAISAYTVGKAVGDKAFLSYSWDSTADEDENMMELTLEVFFTRHVQTQIVTGDSGESSVDVFLRWRF